MKKYVAGVFALLLIFVTVLSVSLLRVARIKGFVQEFSNIHMLSWYQLEPYYVKAESGEGDYALNEGNLYYAAQALTRTSALEYCFFKPDVSGMDAVILTFPDGAVITVADAGLDEDGHDLAYIISTYSGKTRYFKIAGLGTYQRVLSCASPAGFGSMGSNEKLS